MNSSNINIKEDRAKQFHSYGYELPKKYDHNISFQNEVTNS